MTYEDRLKTLGTVQKGWDALRHFLPPDARFIADTMEKHHLGTVAAFYDLVDKDAPRLDAPASTNGEPEAASPAVPAHGGASLSVIEGGKGA